MTSSRRWLVAVSVVALACSGGASAALADERGIDPNQGQSLVEVNLPSKAAAMRLQVEADTYGVEFNDEYLRHNRDGSVTVTVFGDEQGLDKLDAAGYELAHTISGPNIARAPGGAARGRRAQGEARRRRRARRAGHDHLARGRDRDPARRLLRELHGPLSVGRGEDAPGHDHPATAPTRARRCRCRGTRAPARRSTPCRAR